MLKDVVANNGKAHDASGSCGPSANCVQSERPTGLCGDGFPTVHVPLSESTFGESENPDADGATRGRTVEVREPAATDPAAARVGHLQSREDIPPIP